MELGSVTLKRIGFFCFPIKHSTHEPEGSQCRHFGHAEGALYGTELGSVTLQRIGFFCFPIKHSTHTCVALTLYQDWDNFESLLIQ